jgi:DNA repair photolyase
MLVKEIHAKRILSKSQVYEYTVNAYAGCQHACTYCYARFMKRFTGHKEPWGEFVDVKINAADLLSREILRKTPGRVWISGVCDPYQPLEKEYQLTRKCLEILVRHNWPVTIQTRSPLVTRDIDLLVKSSQVEVGMSITTADDTVRRFFEPYAPPIDKRIEALQELHSHSIKTFTMIAPLLPHAEGLSSLLAGKVDKILIDRLNYHYADWVYRKYKLEDYFTDTYFGRISKKLCGDFEQQNIPCQIIF